MKTLLRSYNRLTEPIPPRGKQERSSLRQKKLDDFYNTGIGIRYVLPFGRSLHPERPPTFGRTRDDVILDR